MQRVSGSSRTSRESRPRRRRSRGARDEPYRPVRVLARAAAAYYLDPARERRSIIAHPANKSLDALGDRCPGRARTVRTVRRARLRDNGQRALPRRAHTRRRASRGSHARRVTPRPVASEIRVKEAQVRRDIGRDPRAEVAADEKRRNRRGQSARLLDETGKGRAERELMDARSTNCTGDRHEDRARLAPRTEPAEPIAAEPRDERETGECLDVLNECRGTANAALEP